MTEEHENQIEAIYNAIGKMVAKYAVRFTWVVITVTAAAAGVYFKLDSGLSGVAKSQEETKADIKEIRAAIAAANTATTARIVDWSQWRVLVDSRDDNYERRLAWLETVERNRKP